MVKEIDQFRLTMTTSGSTMSRVRLSEEQFLSFGIAAPLRRNTTHACLLLLNRDTGQELDLKE
jgi:hypothetical protein